MNRILQFIAFLADLVLPENSISAITPEEFEKETKNAELFQEVYPDIIACFSYRHPFVRNIIMALKYKANHHGAVLFAPALERVVIEELGERMHASSDQCFVVPIPRSPDHARRHGANQALLLAQEVTKRINAKNIELNTIILTRTRKTKSQTKTQSREERFENVRGVFTVRNNEHIRGAHIILIDDVVTTGATLTEARLALMRAGAASVVGITAAH